MPLALALAVAVALVTADLAVRALRILLFLRGTGHAMGFRQIFVLNTFGDAAAVVTPLRIGGQPARLAGLLLGGMPLATALPLLVVEMVSYSAVVALASAAMMLLYAPGWWAAVSPAMTESVRWMLPWAAAVGAGSLLVWWAVRRRLRRRGRRRERRMAWAAVRGALGWPLLASVPLTLVSIACRVGVLPVLAQVLPEPPATGVLLISSFVLIYGQLFLPTPGGAGAVELAFSSGAAGDLGGSLGTVYIAWRACTTGIPVVLGFALAIPAYGMAAVRGVMRGRHPSGDAERL